MLAKRFHEHQDPEAATQLVTSHLRLVAKIAMGYRGYGLQVSDLISEGNVGLMQGVKKFEPDRGFRLATYAMWWIKARSQEFLLTSEESRVGKECVRNCRTWLSPYHHTKKKTKLPEVHCRRTIE